MDDDDDDNVPQLVANNVKCQKYTPQTTTHNEDSTTNITSNNTKHHAIPLTILSGWLGAGKTTLLSHILRSYQGQHKELAIINNEIADANVEKSLTLTVKRSDNDEEEDIVGSFTELGGGCVCCSVRDDFVVALDALLERRQFDYILVECSGLANPGELASMFWVDDALESRIYLDGIISVVDAAHLQEHLERREDYSEQIVLQLAYADTIIVNKLDLVDVEDVPILMDRVRDVNGTAKLLSTQHCVVDLEHILHINSFSLERARQVELPSAHTHTCNDGESDKCHHDLSIVSHVVHVDGVMDEELLNNWLAHVLWDNELAGKAVEVFRTKGVVNTDSDKKLYLQGVQKLYSIEPGDAWSNDEIRSSRFVFIGRHLNPHKLQETLATCVHA